MGKNKEEALKNYFLKKAYKKKDNNDDFYLASYIDMATGKVVYNDYELGIDDFNFEDVSELPRDKAIEVTGVELKSIFEMGLNESGNFSRRDWFFYIIKSARAVSNFCCAVMGVDPNSVNIQYYGSDKGYKVIDLDEKNNIKDLEVANKQNNSEVNGESVSQESVANQTEKLIANNQELEEGEIQIQDFIDEAYTAGYLENGKPMFYIGINIAYPMGTSVGRIPDIFCTFFHEMWHVKEYNDKLISLTAEADKITGTDNLVVKEYESSEFEDKTLENANDETKKNFIKQFIDRYKRCAAYSVDYRTWSSNLSERRADLFGTRMTKLFLDDIGADKDIRKAFLHDRKQVMNEHDINSVYVPIRAAIKALLNIDVPEEMNDSDYFAQEVAEDERVSLLSIEKATELNPDLMDQEGFENNDYHNPLEMTEQTAENQREIYKEFLKKNFEAVNKIMEQNEECLNIEYMEEDYENNREDMEAGMYLLN